MLDKVEQYIKFHQLIPSKSSLRLIVGVSGGADSVALLDILRKLQEKWGYLIYVVHVHHGIRSEEGDRDAHFVKRLCSDWNLPFSTYYFDVPLLAKEQKKSIEEMAREVRYKSFKEELHKRLGDRIVVAHHLDDQVETMLMRMIRGTGPKGLVGMLPKQGNLIRPFLGITRAEIEKYCDLNELAYVNDSTNEDTGYTRNRLRKEVIPILKQMNPKFLQSCESLIDILTEEQVVLDEMVQESKVRINWDHRDDVISFQRSSFLKLPKGLKRSILSDTIKMIDKEERCSGFSHVERTIAFIEKSQSGKGIELPGNLTVTRKYDIIQFQLGTIFSCGERVSIKLEEMIECKIDTPLGTLEIQRIPNWEHVMRKGQINELIDGDKLPYPLFIRNRIQGDVFKPYGGNGTKKLKDYFIDLKLPKEKRDIKLLLANGNDVLWISDLKVSEKVAPDSQSVNVFRMKLHNNCKAKK